MALVDDLLEVRLQLLWTRFSHARTVRGSVGALGAVAGFATSKC